MYKEKCQKLTEEPAKLGNFDMVNFHFPYIYVIGKELKNMELHLIQYQSVVSALVGIIANFVVLTALQQEQNQSHNM